MSLYSDMFQQPASHEQGPQENESWATAQYDPPTLTPHKSLEVLLALTVPVAYSAGRTRLGIDSRSILKAMELDHVAALVTQAVLQVVKLGVEFPQGSLDQRHLPGAIDR